MCDECHEERQAIEDRIKCLVATLCSKKSVPELKHLAHEFEKAKEYFVIRFVDESSFLMHSATWQALAFALPEIREHYEQMAGATDWAEVEAALRDIAIFGKRK